MLINTTTELREYLPASVNLDFDDIKPKVRLVEREKLIPAISPAVYALIDVETALTGVLLQLQQLCGEAVAHLALLEYLDFGQVQIDSGGIRIASNEHMKTAFEWQIDQLKEQCSLQGWSAIESALALLDAQTSGALYDAWTGSATKAAQDELLLPTLRSFETFAHLGHSRVLFAKLLPISRALQEDVILPAVGESLFAALLAAESEADATRKTALLKVRKQAAKTLAYLTVGSAFEDTLLVLSDNGPLIINGMQSRLAKAKQSAPETLVHAIATTYQNRADAAQRELIELCQSLAGTLTEYTESANYLSSADQTDHIPRNDPDWGIAFF